MLTATKAQRPWEGSPKLPLPELPPPPPGHALLLVLFSRGRRAGGERVCRAAVSAVCALCADKLPSPDVPRVSRRLLPSRLSPSSESTVLCAGGGQPFPATLPQGLLWPLGARDLHLKVWTLSCPSRHRVFTWVFVHPPEQSPPWRRQLGDGMASPDTAQCLYKSFVTRCSPPG